MLALFQHNTLAYYAFYYAGIFDTVLIMNDCWLAIVINRHETIMLQKLSIMLLAVL